MSADLRAGEFTATHTGPLAAEVLRPAVDYFTRDEVDWLESAARIAADDHIARALGTGDALRDLAAKVARLRTHEVAEEVEPTLGSQTGPAPG
jgi:malonyl CoA-acyl carrier protein transacylase